MTLHFYFARKFLTSNTTLAILTVLVILIDLVEHSRKYSDLLNQTGFSALHY